MTSKKLVLMFGVASIVAALALLALDRAVIERDEPALLMQAAEPFEVTAPAPAASHASDDRSAVKPIIGS